ncbi:MAG TPA: WYL domain-containing protein [Bacteroidales bacterium]|nr:WYL domain-containing protein [Bacteroidales bacterium]HNZ42298.1 WYL domain-containing protein [Bacteroidales bacterium]HOH84057.1 WYL domain-containing protein [Bacteroidales bacterium]HPB24864.1 WYL domain-containing protein [Bacteroidales bacterium]HPI29496.1 WYL domain-containing protein [Bacteroidales bacterium]
MSLGKEAYIRYKVINECLTNRFATYPTIFDIIDACENKLGKTFSVSAIQKDIKAMKEDEALGFLAPIKFSRQYNGYYYAHPDYSINSIPLNSSELEALEAVSDVLQTFAGNRISENFNLAVEKIFTTLKEKKCQIGKKQRYIQTDTNQRQKGFENFERLFHAISNKIPVCFVHYSYNKRCFNSVVTHPFLLKEFQNRWYLVAYSEQHKCLRTFGLDRIRDPLLLDKPFHHVDDKVVDAYFVHIYGTYPWTGCKRQKIFFYASALMSEYIRANPVHESQKEHEIQPDGGVIFVVELIPSQELVNFFKQFSPDVVVLKPAEMVNAVESALKTAFFRYRKNHHETQTL